MTDKRLIEVAFPLKQASIDSVHEKNVRHGHISTLHIWPARRPLAACRAALIATLLPDPGTPEARKALCEKIGGKVVKVVKRKKLPSGKVEDKVVEETVGGILHWGRETENKADVDWFREEIRKAYGGRAPKVLDPFAGGGAIPLEAMRLGCEVTAIDINPVAWFILKCTLEYPQKLAGQKRRLPDFALRDAAFMEEFFKAHGFKKAQIRTFLKHLGLGEDDAPPLPGMGGVAGGEIDPSFLEADLAWHVRAWGRWVLAESRKELAQFYPTYADFQPLEDVEEWREKHPKLVQAMRLVPLTEDGTPDIDALNEEVLKEAFAKDKKFSGKDAESRKHRKEVTEMFFKQKSNPRWVAKPTVAYLWARTVRCKNCRATIPLLKTRWLAKKDRKRVLLAMEPNTDKSGVVFGVESNVPSIGGNNAQKREHDRKLGAGTMSRAGAWCPCCGKPGTVAMEMEDVRQEGVNGRIGAMMTAVVVDGVGGKEYRLPTRDELEAAAAAAAHINRIFEEIPFGIPDESTPKGGGTGAGRAFSVQGYGMMRWRDLFTARQLVALGTVAGATRHVAEAMQGDKYSREWGENVVGFLALMLDRLSNQTSALSRWNQGGEKIEGTFARFALPILWDFADTNPLADTSGAYMSAVEWVSLAVSHLLGATLYAPSPHPTCRSAIESLNGASFDVVVTDPPYYDAIPYSDLMDYFYIWLRRSIGDSNDTFRSAFHEPLSPKWDHAKNDGELIDDSSRHGNDAEKSKAVYEDGMARAFVAASKALTPEGRLVIVFANKQPNAWETLVSAIIKAGFVVDGSWPIQTEMGTRQRALTSAALASSVWLVCRKRPDAARPGWDNTVTGEMRSRIGEQLRAFWDAGIRGPDFVWAATGPAMEAYSKHPFVKKADKPGETMSVSEFLRAVRRIVVDFVVGRVLSEATGTETDAETAATLDDVTTYYLLHRHDFGMDDAPAGACILYAVSCNLSENDLADKYDLLVRSGGVDKDDDGEADAGDADAEGEAEEGSGSTFKLKAWKQRKRPGMGVDPLAEATRSRRLREEAQPRLFEGTAPVEVPTTPKMMPLIDQVHRLMHLWKAGDVTKVDLYLEDRGLRRSELFKQLLQALIELSPEASEERSVLESISNHVQARGISRKEDAKLFVEILEAEQE